MNIAVDTKPTGTAIKLLVEANPVLVLIEPEKFEPFFEAIKEEVLGHIPDLTSKKGRDEIKSVAFKVTRTKTAIDDAGKQLNEAARAQINKVDASRRDIKARLEALADQVRKPLTDWEDAEEERMKTVTAAFVELRGMRVVTSTDTLETVTARMERAGGMAIDPLIFLGQADEAFSARNAVVEILGHAAARLRQEEADRAELARLREEAAERARADAAKTVAEEKKRRDAEAVEAAEQRRVVAEKAEQERIAAAAKRAQEQATAAAERKAKAAIDEMERAHQAELAQARKDRDAADAALRAEADRIAREEAEKAAELRRLADEEAKRTANQKHRSSIMAAAKTAIMKHGDVDEDAAKKIVLAIVAGSIPAVSLRF